MIIKEIMFGMYSIKKNFDSNAELRMNFIFALIGMMLNNSAFLILWYYFGEISDGMNGWQPIDYFGMMGISTIGYGICFGFFGGISELPEIVNRGDFDKYLLSPKNILLRLSSSRFSPSAMGDLFFGIFCLAVWFYFIGVSTISFILAILLSICSASIFYFFSVCVNTVAFYFYDSRPIVQSLFEFLMTPSIFYGGAFSGLFKMFFIFVIPALLLGALPVEIIKNTDLNKLLITFFLVGIWACISVFFFYRSVKKYESSNFINFG